MLTYADVCRQTLTYADVCCVGGRLDAHMNALGAWTANTFHALVMDIEGALLETEPAMGLVLQVLRHKA
jgi:hypothetical protein